MSTQGNPRRPPGLYDPAFEHDSCGVGFVARLDAEARYSVVEDAIQVLMNLEHRGAVGGDKATGDGAGIMLQIPDDLLRAECSKEGIALPEPQAYAVGMVFLPRADRDAGRCEAAVDETVRTEGLEVLGWRRVPIEPDVVGEFARSRQPRIRQCLVADNSLGPEAFRRKLYVVRRAIENRIAEWGDRYQDFYISSLCNRTIVYKGMLTGTQLPAFFPDLRDPRFASAFGMVHQRYSTNTFPSWPLAQPFRFLAHNGEINTLRGNVDHMRAREADLESPLFGQDVDKIKPVIVAGGSDSAMLDNTVELLAMGGRSLPHALMMTVPEAWGEQFLMGEDKRSFYEYHAAIMEPWDGPAALSFADGRYVGAALDRNGLRPARYAVTRDGLVVLASETGVLDIPGENVLQRGRLQPGKMLIVDLEQHRILSDNEIKGSISRQRPYRRMVEENRIELRGLLMPSEIPPEEPDLLRRKQRLFGYTEEELKLIISPMAARGQEAVGSMGNDASLAILSESPQLLFAYFKQLFAQVTNPAIDPLREELVMSLMGFLGRERNLLAETPEHCRRLKLPHPILTPEDMVRLRNAIHPDVVVGQIDMLFEAKGEGEALERALDAVFSEAERHIANGATVLILTDRNADGHRAPVPSLLATSALHHHLIRRGLRTAAGILVETGEAREVMHFPLLIAFGANAICPYLAFTTVRQLAESGMLEGPQTPHEAADSYIIAVNKGLLKTFSRMGISTIRSFSGSQIYEAVGLSEDLIDRYFYGTVSRVGGIGLAEIAAEVRARHSLAFDGTGPVARILPPGGAYRNRVNGEKHLWSPEAVYKLQHALHMDDYGTFKEYVDLIDSEQVTLRSLLRLKARDPVPLDQVESVDSIVPRFVSGAMSLGSIGKEAHETIAVALNRLGCRSNSGEGGEDPDRYVPLPDGDSKCSRTKQVASGRFGVTTEYLMSADELQIKIAQGAKPGEGGQLPGHKVSADIARVRHTTPGVTLISPPPHHDIYSIEDIAQLIYDLRSVNPAARISVKLVSEAGVGTVAAGVAKAKADMILIAGHDGGTGASPFTAIKHVGLPWELGLAEAQQTLIQNRLRQRVRLQVDGQLRTGRDLAIAAFLGAEEFGFGSIVLVSLGCVMMRKCHLNTCPVGVATQDQNLRSRFAGRPEHVERLFRFIARDLREHMAAMGFCTVDEMVGRTEMLEEATSQANGKAGRLDLSRLLHSSPSQATRYVTTEDVDPDESLDLHLLREAQPALERRESVRLDFPVRNVHRTVGSTLSGEIVKRFGSGGLPDDTIAIALSGSAGQSLGAVLAPGVTIRVEGDANDYLGKGLAGGKLIVVPPEGTRIVAHENTIVGNVVLYGATGGETYICGMAGERFAIRNSGARAVVEGLGDHGCEYMTGGVVVVLGRTGHNFAAGMSGGIAYVHNESGLFDTRCNLDMVDLESVMARDDVAQLRAMLESHVRYTGSARAEWILEHWEERLPHFVKVMPIEYRKSLERMRLREDAHQETISATEEVYRG